MKAARDSAIRARASGARHTLSPRQATASKLFSVISLRPASVTMTVRYLKGERLLLAAGVGGGEHDVEPEAAHQHHRGIDYQIGINGAGRIARLRQPGPTDA